METAYDCKRPPGGGKAFTICNRSLSRICSSGSSADSKPELPFIVGEQSGDAHLATYVQLPVVGLRLCPWSLFRALFRLAHAALLCFSLSLTAPLCMRACVRVYVWVCVNVWICVWLCKLLTLCVFMPATPTSDSQFSETLILLFIKENPFNVFVLINLHTHHQKTNGCGDKLMRSISPEGCLCGQIYCSLKKISIILCVPFCTVLGIRPLWCHEVQ